MNRIITFICLLMCFSLCFAQAPEQERNSSDHVFYVTIPKKINIKDKVILVNRTPHTILQAAVVVMEDGVAVPVGNVGMVKPGGSATVASFSDNALKKLKGKTLGIKIKGVKKVFGNTKSTGVGGGSWATGPFGLGIEHTEISADELNNIDEDLITYDFNAHLSESSHDLYITVATGENVFDF